MSSAESSSFSSELEELNSVYGYDRMGCMESNKPVPPSTRCLMLLSARRDGRSEGFKMVGFEFSRLASMLIMVLSVEFCDFEVGQLCLRERSPRCNFGVEASRIRPSLD